MKQTAWFSVDKEGLAKLLERRGKEFAIFELVQNCWDQKISSVKVKLEPIANKPFAILTVEDDDPEGFADLSHAFTLFAESTKKADPTKRGRFNLGEKLVLALCEEASITTTSGTITFNKAGRQHSRAKIERGSRFVGVIRMTRTEYEQVCKAVDYLIPPKNITTTFNGLVLVPHKLLHSFNVALPTEIADKEGILRKTNRITTIDIYEVASGESAYIYEMGIPVVETGDKWHVDISQKVPLNTDRDNITAGFLKLIRTYVFNEMHNQITSEDATSIWVKEAMSDPRCNDEAIKTGIKKRFSDKCVINDPSDPEGTKIAHSKGYQIIFGGTLSSDEWKNVKRSGAVLPAGQVTPSPKLLSVVGDGANKIPEEKYTDGMREIVYYTIDLAKEILNIELAVEVVNQPSARALAWYGRTSDQIGSFTFNVGALRYSWFQNGINNAVNELIIHELGHHYSSDHRSEDYWEGLCLIGARMVNLALANPSFFQRGNIVSK